MTSTDLITAKETAQRLHVAVGTLKRWRRGQSGPPWCRIGSRAVRYPVALLEVWLGNQNTGAGFDTGDDPEGNHCEDGPTGIIHLPAADQGPQPPRWTFLDNIPPKGM